MATLYRGNKTLYQDDKTGEIWDSQQRRIRFNDDGSQFDGKIEVKQEKPIAVIDPEAKEEPGKELECGICGFEAKSSAGLAVHKMKHNTEKHEDQIS